MITRKRARSRISHSDDNPTNPLIVPSGILASVSDGSNIYFEVSTPLGFRVRVTHSYWELIVTIKHPVMAGRELAVRETLQSPDPDSRQ
jgi:hypothetical protein